MLNLQNKYKVNYTQLKVRYRTTSRFDFAITFDNLPELNMENTIPDASEVITKDFLEEVLYPNGTVVNTIVTFRVW